MIYTKNGTAYKISMEETELHTWFERDRQHVELRETDTERTILEFWDESVTEIVDDGFLDPADWHGSLYEYADYLGLLTR